VSIGEVTERIAKIEEGLMDCTRLAGLRVSSLEADVNHSIQVFKELTENKVAGQVLTLTPHITRMYLDAEYHLACALFYASPALFAILSAIWGVIVFVYNIVKWTIDILHIRELLIIADILKVIWPAFRDRMNAIYAKVSEFSASIGWGADGLLHLIQSAQQGINVLGGLMGKDDSWLRIKGADRVITALQAFSGGSNLIATDPGRLFDIVFGVSTRGTHTDALLWWRKTEQWIQKAADTAEDAIRKVSAAIGSLQDLENRLPAFVRENIPAAIWEGLNRADAMIDGTLLPALSRIDRTFSEVNAVLEAHRKTAASLVDQLTRPGDVLLGVDKLTDAGRLAQENIIDDVTSRKYERDAEDAEIGDGVIIAEFARIAQALEAPAPPPAYLTLEYVPGKIIPGIVLEDRETWFVGDY